MRNLLTGAVLALGILSFSPAQATVECVSPSQYTDGLKERYPMALVNAMVEQGEALDGLVAHFNSTPPLYMQLAAEDVDMAIVYQEPSKPMLMAVFFKDNCFVSYFTFPRPNAEAPGLDV